MIICCIHVIAYFSWCDEVLLYFIVWVEVVEIQIWFVIKKTDLKKKRISYLKIGIWAESTARPNRPHRARAACAAQQIHGCSSHNGSKPDQITPDPTR
jgi:hypothetical protein